MLEQYNPDVQFDWTHILKPTPAAVIEPPKDGGFDQGQPRGQRRKERRAVPREPEVRWTAPQSSPVRTVEEFIPEPPPIAVDEPEEVNSAPIDVSSDGSSEEARLVEEALEGPDDDSIVEPVVEGIKSAAYERLGSEGLARLRARYAEVMARIAERPMDDAAREELKLRAERLNPDGWVTTDEVQQALEQYESVFEGLRALVGTRRRRRRRRGGSRKTES